MSAITDFFKKRGIKDESELTPEEQVELTRWKEILAKETLDIGDVLAFCQGQRSVLEQDLSNVDAPSDKIQRIALLYTLYGKIIALIESPKVQREALIRYIESLPNVKT